MTLSQRIKMVQAEIRRVDCIKKMRRKTQENAVSPEALRDEIRMAIDTILEAAKILEEPKP